MPTSNGYGYSPRRGRHGNNLVSELIVGDIYLDLECEDVIICTQVVDMGAGVCHYRCHSVSLNRGFIYDIDDLCNIIPANMLVRAVLKAQEVLD